MIWAPDRHGVRSHGRLRLGGRRLRRASSPARPGTGSSSSEAALRSPARGGGGTKDKRRGERRRTRTGRKTRARGRREGQEAPSADDRRRAAGADRPRPLRGPRRRLTDQLLDLGGRRRSRPTARSCYLGRFEKGYDLWRYAPPQRGGQDARQARRRRRGSLQLGRRRQEGLPAGGRHLISGSTSSAERGQAGRADGRDEPRPRGRARLPVRARLAPDAVEVPRRRHARRRLAGAEGRIRALPAVHRQRPGLRRAGVGDAGRAQRLAHRRGLQAAAAQRETTTAVARAFSDPALPAATGSRSWRCIDRAAAPAGRGRRSRRAAVIDGDRRPDDHRRPPNWYPLLDHKAGRPTLAVAARSGERRALAGDGQADQREGGEGAALQALGAQPEGGDRAALREAASATCTCAA